MGNYRLRGYHNTGFSRRNVTGESGALVGVELEVEHPEGYLHILEALPDTNNAKLRPSTETDGSIDYVRGVEIVFPPMKPSQLSNGNSFIRRSFKALDECGIRSSSSCGMHVNINTHDWTPRTIHAYVAMFFVLNPDVLKAIGGRALNRYCGQGIGTLDSRDINQHYVRCRGSHHNVVSPRNGRIELRFPASTTRIEKLQTVVAFSNYVKKFVEEVSQVSRRSGTIEYHHLTKEPWAHYEPQVIGQYQYGSPFREAFRTQVTQDLLTMIDNSRSSRSKTLVMDALTPTIKQRYGLNARTHRSTTARPAL